jgi:hypothetical protein
VSAVDTERASERLLASAMCGLREAAKDSHSSCAEAI